jgi:isocitrate dehydrogenase
VVLRQELGLYANIRPVEYFPGIATRLKDPERLKTVVFRENTEDVYMGIEAKPGSEEARLIMQTVVQVLGAKLPKHYPYDLVGVGIKLMSHHASERIMFLAMQYAINHGLKKVVIMHKGNIMKYTEGFFKQTCIDFVKTHYPNLVYVKGEEADYSEEERAKRIFIDVITADDIFDKIQSNPERFELIVCMNLNGDYVSDAAAGQVGGAPLSASANVGDDCVVFEAIGGTADDIAGKNIANPTAFFMAFAMMLDHKGFMHEAQAIRDAIAQLFKQGIGTADMKFTVSKHTKVSTTDFAQSVAQLVLETLALTPAASPETV